MQTRTRVPATGAPVFSNPVPLLEAGDLPGDDDWAILEAVRREPHGDEDIDLSFHPDFD